jgi:MFS family permease
LHGQRSGERARRWLLVSMIGAAGIYGAMLGVTYPLLALLLEAQGASDALIGASAAMTPAGCLVSAPLLPWSVRRVGPWWVMVCSLAGTALVLLAIWLWRDPVAWFPLRLVLGFAINGVMGVSETWINLAARPESRGRTLGAYTSFLATGFALGPVLLAAVGPASPVPFAVGIGLTILSALSLLPVRGAAAPMGQGGALPVGLLLRRHGALLLGVVALALFDGALLSLLPVYALAHGIGERQAALLLTPLVVGNMVLQFPVGWLADRLDRRAVLAGCALAGCVGALLLPLVVETSFWFWPVLMAWGGLTFGIYPVVLAVLGHQLAGDDLLNANMAIAAVWGVGGLAGPALVGAVMQAAGPGGLPVSLALVWGVLTLFLALRGGAAASWPAQGPGDASVTAVSRKWSATQPLCQWPKSVDGSSISSSRGRFRKGGTAARAGRGAGQQGDRRRTPCGSRGRPPRPPTAPAIRRPRRGRARPRRRAGAPPCRAPAGQDGGAASPSVHMAAKASAGQGASAISASIAPATQNPLPRVTPQPVCPLRWRQGAALMLRQAQHEGDGHSHSSSLSKGEGHRCPVNGLLQQRADLPQLREEAALEHPAEIGDPGGAAGAALHADNPLHRLDVSEAPLLEGILEVDQLLGQLVEIPVPGGVAIDGEPGVAHRGVRLVGLAPVALQPARRDREAASGEQPDRLVIEAGPLQRLVQQGVAGRPVAMGRQQGPVLVAEDELDQPVLVGLESRGVAEPVPEGEIVGRRQRRQHVPGLDQLRLDARHPGGHLEGRGEVVGADPLARRLELVQRQLQPQLGRLVHDDEQHLVMLRRKRPLAVEQPVELQVLAIAHRLAEVGMGAGLRRLLRLAFRLRRVLRAQAGLPGRAAPPASCRQGRAPSYCLFTSAISASTLSVGTSPVVTTWPFWIRHRRNGPVMSPFLSNCTAPITPT